MVKRLSVAAAILFLVVLAGAATAYVVFDRMAGSPADPSAPVQVFEVPKGASVRRVAQMLEEQGFIASAQVLNLHLLLQPLAEAPKAGRHEISARMTGREIMAKLAGPPLPDDVPLTIVEGWRLRDIDAFLAGQGLIEAGAYLRAASEPSRFRIPFDFREPNLEGYLFPETYRIPANKLNIDAFIQRKIDAFAERFQRPYRDEIAQSGRKLRDLVILASLLEREEPVPEIRPKVAGVLYNRLDSPTPFALGVDATSRYTLDEWNHRRKFLKQLRDPNDPYNTRLRTGLPPTPIGAPSLSSLVAALRPERTPYWYYLHDSRGNIHFGRNARQHEANRRKYNVW